ncbi:hypothetical protein N658DRAFT_210974 [Parathielavia hyrcaniae]|uniref:Uncharacterized protein n=1 Tax=Parathielavia hyrcaniae TaxID=113614 RepID=A0AAN6PZ77_9PEZI|nr:hypothetical protein N658DRAFT_210974 [Parathielavia hyrcaniae]
MWRRPRMLKVLDKSRARWYGKPLKGTTWIGSTAGAITPFVWMLKQLLHGQYSRYLCTWQLRHESRGIAGAGVFQLGWAPGRSRGHGGRWAPEGSAELGLEMTGRAIILRRRWQAAGLVRQSDGSIRDNRACQSPGQWGWHNAWLREQALRGVGLPIAACERVPPH